jgi:hypothetical protein
MVLTPIEGIPQGDKPIYLAAMALHLATATRVCSAKHIAQKQKTRGDSHGRKEDKKVCEESKSGETLKCEERVSQLKWRSDQEIRT